MSVRAGSIVTVGGRNVVDRLQSAGLDGNVPIETVREIGNDLVVGKVPGEPEYTFRMESWDVSTDLMALLHGAIGNQAANQPPGQADPAGTEYRWEDVEFINLTSPWKNQVGSAGGVVGGGLLIPGYFPTRLRYRFGVTDMASQEVELAGGSFYYAPYSPVEEAAVGDGVVDAFITSEAARALRVGGAGGTTFRYVFGVIVDGVLQAAGTDYVETNAGVAGAPGLGTITFTDPPAVGAQIRFTYFSNVAKAFPQAVNADTTVKPAAVRGRNIVLRLDPDGADVRLPGVQSYEQESTIESEIDREMGNPEPVGRSVTGVNTTGSIGFRPRDIDALFNALEQITGVAANEVHGFFNENPVPMAVEIQNPKNPGEILKTLFVEDAKIQPPPLAARVNTATDFTMAWESENGTFAEFKGARP